MADSPAARTTPMVSNKEKARLASLKKTMPKVKNKRPAPSHPKVSEMVVTAVTTLKERGGSSLQAIKKYMAANYTVDVEKLAPFIRKYLKAAVVDGTLVQTKGTGASGSFKLGAKAAKKEKKPKVAVKPAKEKKPVKPAVENKVPKPKKVAKPIKKATKSPKKPKTTPKKAKSPKKTKVPKKEKAKTPKTKSPKPKKAAKKTAKK